MNQQALILSATLAVAACAAPYQRPAYRAPTQAEVQDMERWQALKETDDARYPVSDTQRAMEREAHEQARIEAQCEYEAKSAYIAYRYGRLGAAGDYNTMLARCIRARSDLAVD